MRMPRRVKVGAHVSRILRPRVIKTKDGSRINGYCHVDALTKVPLKHEEEMVELISSGLLQILKDNPNLVSFLTQK